MVMMMNDEIDFIDHDELNNLRMAVVELAEKGGHDEEIRQINERIGRSVVK